MNKLPELLGAAAGSALAGVYFVILAMWTFGGLIGAIYWAVQDDLIFVVLSIFIPGFGAISTIIDVFF